MSLTAEKEQFFAALSRMLKSGVPILRAAEVLSGPRTSVIQRRWISDLQEGLAAGEPIVTALRGNGTNLLTETDLTLLEAAERGGKLEEGALHLGRYYATILRMQRGITSAMVRPALLLLVALLVAGLLRSLGAESGVIAFFVPLIAGSLICGAAAAAVVWILKQARVRADFDRMLNCLPIIGRLRKAAAMARFNRVLSISLLAGISVSESLRLATVAAESAALTESMRPILREVADGVSPGALLMANQEIPQAISHTLSTAEAAGEMEVAAKELAAEQQQEMAAAADSLAAWAPRIIGGIVGAYAVYKILSFYLGYFSAFEAL